MSGFKDIKFSLAKTNLLTVDSDERNLLKEENKRIVILGDVEKVRSIDQKNIELVLKSDRIIDTENGFLVEVFLSGTDGKLTRLYRDSVESLNENTTEIGFSEYFKLEIDK